MSCSAATAPIDIHMGNIKGKCDYKCSFHFHYNTSTCVATNRGDYVSIAYDKSSSPPVQYNSTGYDVEEIRLYSPSLHSFNGTKADAELIIVHYSKSGASPLLVCVPVNGNNTSSASTQFFTTLVDAMSASAPSEGESTIVDAPKFNLSGLVPRKPFFSYTATEPYQPCSTGAVEYIVFQASLDIPLNSLDNLQNIIATNGYDIKTGPSLFYNEKGPGVGAGDGEIYIDCQPVGASEEETDVSSGSSTLHFNWKDWMKNPIVQILLGSIMFIALVFVAYGISKLLSGGKISMPEMPKGATTGKHS
jgi:carbonic anhydrase